MKIATAHKMLDKEYERAKRLEFVHDPVAWALYYTWKAADADMQKKLLLAQENRRKELLPGIVFTNRGSKRKE